MGNSHQFSGYDVTHDDLLAVGGGFDHLNPSIQEHEERGCFLALLKDWVVFRNAQRVRALQHRIKAMSVEALEYRQSGYERTVELIHINSLLISARLLWLSHEAACRCKSVRDVTYFPFYLRLIKVEGGPTF
jgi:hypothetical protein